MNKREFEQKGILVLGFRPLGFRPTPFSTWTFPLSWLEHDTLCRLLEKWNIDHLSYEPSFKGNDLRYTHFCYESKLENMAKGPLSIYAFPPKIMLAYFLSSYHDPLWKRNVKIHKPS